MTNPSTSLAHAMNLELERCGWKDAERHFRAACDATLAHDDAGYHREMAEFNRIKSTWQSREAGVSNKPPASNQ